MGYQTSYSLSLETSGGFTEAEVLAEIWDRVDEDGDLNKLPEAEAYQYALVESGDTNESCKWYDHESFFRELSSSPKYRKVLFILSGDGEEQGDSWRKYFRNGKMQDARAVITYEDFDPKKLR